MRESAEELQSRFRLPDIALGVDGTHIELKNKPRQEDCVNGTVPQDFWCR